jgi:hypothetical protein
MDHVWVLRVRVACASAVAALLLGGVGGWSPRAASVKPPTPADFVMYPTCMLYASGADLRLRVRAPRAAAVCRRLSRQLAGFGVRWSRRARAASRILSPICLFADPRAKVELEVIDDAVDGERGARICAGLEHAGWFDLETP